MGIPYSKQIHAAFDQVTPLVWAGYEVAKTTKNIAILLAIIQVLTALLLSLILLALLALLVTANPDLERERRELVTPSVRWLASWVLEYGGVVAWVGRVGLVLGLAGLGVFFWVGSRSGEVVVVEGSPAVEGVVDDVDDEGKE